jgi:hypothetical protein
MQGTKRTYKEKKFSIHRAAEAFIQRFQSIQINKYLKNHGDQTAFSCE